MFDLIRRLSINKKIKKHKAHLKKVCEFGVGFCESKFYSNRDKQLLQVKINNHTGDSSKIQFGDYCNVSCKINLNKHGSIVVGNHVFMNYSVLRIDYNLRIGSTCMFGPNVTFWDTDNHPLSISKRRQQAIDFSENFPLIRSYEAGGGDIIIEDNVWIGMDALIMGGVTIGEGAVVAARSVVTRDVEPRTLVGGIPARFISNIPVDE